MRNYEGFFEEPSKTDFLRWKKLCLDVPLVFGVLGVLIIIFPAVSGADIAIVLYMLKKSYWAKLPSESEGSSSWSHFHNCIKHN